MDIHRWIGSSICAAAVVLGSVPAAVHAQLHGHYGLGVGGLGVGGLGVGGLGVGGIGYGGIGYGGIGYGGIGYGGLAAPYGSYSGLHHHSHHFYGGNYYSPYGSRTYFSPFGLGYGYSSYGLGYPQLSLGYSIGRLYQPYYGLYGPGLYGSHFGSYYPGYYSGNLYSNGFYSSLYGATITDPLLTIPSTNALLDAAMLNGRYLRAARSSFAAGDYAKAQRFANHSILEMPGDAKSHEILSLAQFAQGDYRGAAAAAHKAAELAPVADWKTLYRYYGDESKYAAHLDSLTKFIRENPGSADARFVIAVHLLMMGHKEQAKQQFAEYLKLVPGDAVAEKLALELASEPDTLPAPSAPAAASEPAEKPAEVKP